MWKNIERGRAQMIIWRMRIACCIPKTENAHKTCVILIALHYNNGCTNVPQCYVITYIASLVITVSFEDALIKFCDADI